MKYQIRSAQRADLPAVQELYAKARQFMAGHRNPDQWGSSYPPEEILRQDMAREKLFLITDAAGIHGVFYFSIEVDPTYAVVEDGCWSCERTYGVLHRIAGDGSGGILKAAVEYARERIEYMRIDTHADNYVMQNALVKQGFRRCGIIHIEDGTARIAYDSIQGVREALPTDRDRLLELYLHLHESSIPGESETLVRTWERILEDPDHHLIVYEQEGQIRSSCVCVVIPNLTRGIRPYAFVENVVTHEEHRGKGFGRACLARAKTIAEAEGCYKLMLLTGSKDPGILEFYQKAGYNTTDKTAFVQWL